MRDRNPCFYYPTTTVFIDDDKNFLKHLAIQMAAHSPFISFHDPREGIKYIQKNQTDNSVVSSLHEDVDLPHGISAKDESIKVSVSISSLYKNIYNSARNQEVSVIVVDYSMPEMNGAELCQHLKDSPVKKIMLTGQADEKMAIQLFNNGIIDAYIHKHSDSFLDELENLIKKMQHFYFVDKSSALYENLAITSDFCLKDPHFQTQLASIIHRLDIVEYYLISTNGSLLMLQADGHPIWLLIATQAELNDYKVILDDHDGNTSIKKLVANGIKIPFFNNTEEMFNADGMKWEPYLHYAKKIEGESTFYYSVISDQLIFPIAQEHILPYKKYLADQRL